MNFLPTGANQLNLNGLWILMELMNRLKAGIFGGNDAPRELVDACWIEGGYNLDAPLLLPGGACQWYQVDEEGGLPEQILIQREKDVL